MAFILPAPARPSRTNRERSRFLPSSFPREGKQLLLNPTSLSRSSQSFPFPPNCLHLQICVGASHSLLSHCLTIMLHGGNFPFFCVRYFCLFLMHSPPPFCSLRAAKDVFGNTSSNTVIIAMETCYQMEDLTVMSWISSGVDSSQNRRGTLCRASPNTAILGGICLSRSKCQL